MAPSAARAAADQPESWRLLFGPRLLVVALVLWAWGLADVNLRAMSDYGLLSVLPTVWFLALAALTVGFLFVLDRTEPARRLLGAYVLTLVAMVHGTPALLADTPWFSSAYPQLGSIDTIARTGDLGVDGAGLAIHAGWPGSPGFTALVSELTGFEPSSLARWMPIAVVVVSLLALVHVYRAFTPDARVVWLGVWLVVLGNWIGHELFAPVGFASMLHLAVVALVVRLDRWDETADGLEQGRGAHDPLVARRRSLVAVVVLVLGTAVAVSDLTTAIVMIASLGALDLARVARARWFALAIAAVSILWVFGPALDALRSDALADAHDRGLRAETATTSPLDLDLVSAGHQAAVVADRFLVQAMIVLAAVGLIVLRRQRAATPILLLSAAPLVLVVLRFDADALFRIVTFALPWLAFAAASGLVALTDRRDVVTSLGARAVVLTVLLISFLFADLGRLGVAHFTKQEVALADWIGDHAGAGTLVLVGSPNHPVGSTAADRITVVPITDARTPDLVAADEDPAEVLHALLSDGRFERRYLLLTRSMFEEQRFVPTTGPAELERIESAVRASDRFVIVEANVDGSVWMATGAASG